MGLRSGWGRLHGIGLQSANAVREGCDLGWGEQWNKVNPSGTLVGHIPSQGIVSSQEDSQSKPWLGASVMMDDMGLAGRLQGL